MGKKKNWKPDSWGSSLVRFQREGVAGASMELGEKTADWVALARLNTH